MKQRGGLSAPKLMLILGLSVSKLQARIQDEVEREHRFLSQAEAVTRERF